jgi:hypothetical protein
MLSHAHAVLLEKCTKAITANKSLSIANSTTEATICFLRSKIGVLKSEKVAADKALSLSRSSNGSLRTHNAELQEKNASLTTAKKSLEAENTNLQRGKQVAEQEYATAREELSSALKDAQDSRQRFEELQHFKQKYESSQAELIALQNGQRKMSNLQTSFDSLIAEHNAAKSQMKKLEEELVELREHPATIKRLREQNKNAQDGLQKLEDQLLQVNASGSRVEELEKSLRAEKESIGNLQREIESKKGLEQQLKESTTEKDRLSEELALAQKNFHDVQKLLERQNRVNEDLKQKEREIKQLRKEAGRVTELSQQLKSQNGEVQAKDQVAQELRQQEGQATTPTASAGAVMGLDGFTFPSRDPDISFLQSQKPDGEAILTKPAAQSKQSRVADRSGAATTTRARTLNPPEASQASFSAFIDFVPDSQQGPIADNVGDRLEVGRRSVATSPLTELDSDEIAALSPDNEEQQSLEPEIPETVPLDLIVVDVAPSSPNKRGNSLVRPSSAMTDDLFKQHAKNLETASSFGSRSYLPEIEDSLLRHGHPMSTERSTIDPQDLIIAQYTTPGRHNKMSVDRDLKTPAAPAFVSAIPVSGGSSSRHPPNSAVKRKAEGPASPARKARLNPANYDNLKITTPKLSAFKQAGSSKSSAGLSRRTATRSSIVGTSAPASGKTQKAAKPKRKNSKNDKYEKQFNGTA